MESSVALRIAQRFSTLSKEHRRAVHAQMRSQGVVPLQLPILPRPCDAEPVLSYAQARQWFLWKLDPQSTAYHITSALRLTGSLEMDALCESFATLIHRHESLRTIFEALPDGTARPVVVAARFGEIPVIDLRSESAEVRERRALEEARRIAQTTFDLTTGPLLRVAVLLLADDESVLVLAMHHIVSDGWSMQLFVDEFGELYSAHAERRRPRLETPPIQYADFALWQRSWLEAGELERQLEYWRDRLGSEHPVLQVPTDHPRQASPACQTARFSFEIPLDLSKRAARLAQARGATVFMALLAAFQVLLFRYSRQSDIRVGVPNANRNRVEAESVIGLFVNTHALRNVIEGHHRLGDVLARTRESMLGAQAHQDLPFEQLVDALQPERSLNHPPLFQVMMNHQRRADGAVGSLPGLKVQRFGLGGQAAKFELTLDTSEGADGVVGAAFTYAQELFERETIERMSGHYLKVLRALVEQPELRVSEVPLLSEAECVELRRWEVNERHYGDVRPVHRVIEEQVRARPSATALVVGARALSYAELNGLANRLAHRLIALGVGPEVRVGIAVERSVEMVVGLLAVMKAGGAYVPLDPEYPAERLEHMVRDSGVGLLLTHAAAIERVPPVGGVSVLELDSLYVSGESDADPEFPLHDENLAYVIYTSGSTGRPKGAANRHRSLYNRLVWMQEAYGLSADDAVLQKTPFSFDVSVWEFFWPLMYGARLVMAPPGAHRDPEQLVRLIRSYEVTTLHFVPSMLNAFLEHEGIEACASIRRIVCSGEALSVEAQRKVFARLPAAKLHNLYGPTEAAIDVTHWTCIDEVRGTVPIGRPIADTQVVILDAELNPVPRGVAGELCLGGVGLGRGYLNRAGLTAERFIADVQGEHGERLYRTGDLVRWSADGQLEYLGRLDHQVKIRGFRIELGEIESQLLAQPEVREAVVIAREGAAGVRLVAYVAGHAAASSDKRGTSTVPLTTSALRERLAQRLPDYMVPSAIVALDRLPLTANGKLDRKALPEPNHSATTNAYESPQGEVEHQLATIWCDVLGLDRIGRHDNFFSLGGDSILSLQIVARARTAGWRLTPRQVFERQTLAQLAAVAESLNVAARAGEGVDAPESFVGAVPLLPIQRWFFDQPISWRHHWNQAVLLDSREVLRPTALGEALQAVIQHHDALRLRFRYEGETGWIQTYAEDDATHGTNTLWLRHAPAPEAVATLCAEAQQSLDLSSGPLLRAVLIDLGDGAQRLLVVIHHLVIDGVSWRVLLEDLQRAYRQASAGQRISLPPRTSSFQRWAHHLQSYPANHADELAYWQSLIGVPAGLPCDNESGANTIAEQSSITISLDRTQTHALLKETPAAYRTQVQDVLLTALSRALTEWSGHEQLLIHVEGHGREDLFDGVDLSRTVGWFTTLYPVALDAHGEPGDALKRVKETLRSIPHRGVGYGALKYNGTPTQQSALARIEPGQVVFNYLGQLDSSFDDHALWKPAPEGAGLSMHASTPRPHAFSINGRVYDGQLRLVVNYSNQRHRRETVQRWATAFQRELESLIAHCSEGVRGLTPSDVPLAKISQTDLDRFPVNAAELEDLYPLSALQRGLLFHSLQEGAGTYVNQLRVDIEGLDVERFVAAWQAVVARHASLRSGFLLEQSVPLQWVANAASLDLVQKDWRNRSNLSAALDEFAESQRNTPFDLRRPPLMRMALVKTGEQTHHLVWTHHHALMDGWSAAQVTGEVLHHYHRRSLPALRGRFRDYIQWLQQRDASASETFWKEQLQKLQEPTRLSAVISARSGKADQTNQVLTIDRRRTARLETFAREQRVTINTLLQAAWALLLSRLTGQSCVAFGATTAGRPAELAGVEQLVGLFINTFPVVAEPAPHRRVGDWLRDLQTSNLAAREHEHTPLHDIQRWAGHGGQGLFDTLLVFENYPVDRALREGSTATLRFSGVRHQDRTHYPLTLVVGHGETLTMRFSSQGAMFDAEAVARLAAQMQQLLEALCVSAERHVGEIGIAEAAESEAVRARGEVRQRFEVTQPLHWLIEEQARRRPQAIAVTLGTNIADADEDVGPASARHSLTYAELNRRANHVAHRLIAQGVKPETRVGLQLERSPELIVGMLAILKAGAAYVPLDPRYPPERLDYLVRDSGIEVWLDRARLAELERKASHDHSTASAPASTSASPHDHDANHNPDVPVHPDHLAYVIYTSGSTGRPKGAQLTHRNVLRLLQGTQEWFDFNDRDVWTLFHSFAFDFSVWEIFGALATGARLVIVPYETSRSPEDFLQLLKAEQVTVLNQTPSAFRQLMQVPGLYDTNNLSLRAVIFGGEALDVRSLRSWLEHFGEDHPRLINMYGITETTVHVTYRPITLADALQATSPIGEPIPDLGLRVLDAQLQLAPVGAPGELYVAGEGLARGYLGRAALTSERFIADPHAGNGTRLYRTGDRVRWTADGDLEYLGRIDQQVKIRGFRIELGEIEAQLLAQPEVREAVVIARGGTTGPRLLAYVVGQSPTRASSADTSPGENAASTTPASLDTAVLRERLARRLPDYMLPSALIALDSLPLNANGKLDRKALPEPNHSATTTADEPPQGEVEHQLAAIWRDVLGITRISRHDNFFALGGHSLLLLDVMNRAHRTGDPRLKLRIRDLMQAPTLANLSRVCEGAAELSERALMALNRTSGGASTRAVFCLHPGLGTVFNYLPLARRLENVRPVYGIVCRTHLDPAFRDSSIEQMAADYYRMIRAQQPRGPYSLLGWSSGGVLAWLIAGMLEADGQVVEFLGLVDTTVPRAPDLHQQQDDDENDWKRSLSFLLKMVAPTLDAAAAIGRLTEDPFASTERLTHFLATVMTGHEAKLIEGYTHLSMPDLANIFVTFRNLGQLISRYTPASLALKASPHCWWATSERRDESRQRLQSILNCADSRHDEVDASHFSIIGSEAFLQSASDRLSDGIRTSRAA